MTAEDHWLALDRTFSHILSASQAAHAHPRFAHRAHTLSNIYLPRLLAPADCCLDDDEDSTRQLAELREAHRLLSSALAARWNQDT